MLKKIALHLAATAVAILATATYASEARSFNIPPGDLAPALESLAKETGLELIFQPNELKGIQTQGVTGTLSPQEAVAKLINGTRLTIRTDSAGAILIAAPTAASAVKSDARNIRLAQNADNTETKENSELSSDSAENKGIQEIVVTAQKRTERLIDVPQSVSVLSADDLAKLGATQFRDFADTVPGLTFQTSGPGLTQISLRGVTVGQDVSATVGVYVDDVPYGSSTSFARGGQVTLDAGLFDLDRIEILRGPQGTLYGASTMGGLLKYVTRQPQTADFNGLVQASLSSTSHGEAGYNVAGMINVPLKTDKIALRASGFYTRDGGYIDNLTLGEKDVNSSDIRGGRVDLLFTPTEALGIRLTGFIQDIGRDGFPLADYSRTGVPVDGSLTQRRLFSESFDQQFRLGSATVSYDFGSTQLTSISSYQTIESDFFNDNTRNFLAISRSVNPAVAATALVDYTATDKFTQEVRLASRGVRVLDWQIGAFYTKETSAFTQAIELRDAAGQSLPNNVLTLSTPTRCEEQAAFGDVTWNLTERFDVTGGLRYARNRDRFEQRGSGAFGLSAPQTRSTDEVFTYLANARYHFNDRATGYLRYATGYRPGGPNLVIPGLSPDELTFEADRLKSYEVGFKADTDEARFGMDIAAYYIDWSNIIVTVTRGGFGARANAPGGASIQGAELTLTARPSRAFVVTGAFAYQDAELSEADPTLRGAKGERLPNVPDFTAALSTDYQLPVGSLQPTIGATLRYVGDRTAAYNNSPASRPQYQLPEYTTVDLRAGFTLGSANAQFYVRNIFDERAQIIPRLLGQSALNAPVPISILQPRTIGITVSTAF